MSGFLIISGSTTKKTTANPEHAVGVLATNGRGDLFRYAKAGASGVSAGKLQLAPTPKTNHDNVAVAAAAAAGAFEVTVTLGATAAVADEYAGGVIVINDADGEGGRYIIAGHPAANSSTSLTLTLAEPLDEALTTSSEACLVHNTWQGVQEGTTSTLAPAGVPLVDIAARS